MIRMRLLGKVDLTLSDSTEARSILSQPKPLGVLAFLVIASGRGFRRRDELVGLFWPESSSARARNALSQALYVIRGALGPDVIRTRGDQEVGIDPDRLWSDVTSFREAFAAGRFEEALNLYEGDLLTGFFLAESADFDQWLERERILLRSQATESAWQMSKACESLGQTGEARHWALRATELAPYNEEGLRKYLGLLDRLGDRAEAIRAFETYRQRILTELEIEPSPATVALADSIREQASGALRPEPAVVARAAPVSQAISPLKPAGEIGGDSAPKHYWRRRRNLRYALVSIPILALALIVSWRWNRSAEAKTRAGSQTDHVVVADFESNVSDTVLANTVRDAMRLDLSRSARVRPLSDARIRHALSLMQRDSAIAIDRRVAREVALREGAKAVLEGDVRVSRGGYSLSARLVAAETGELVGGWRASARTSSDLIGAIEKLATSVRTGAGESLADISATSTLFRVSTKSIVALRKHAMATTAYFDEDFTRALGLFEEAIAIDSTFADALMSRAVTLAHLGIHPAREVEATIAAYRHRDQLNEAEKYAVTGAYLLTVKGDAQGAINALYNEAALAPEIVFWGRFASLLSQQRRYREAELAALNGLKWSPNPFAWWHLANIRFKAGRTADAKRTVAESLKRFPNHALMLAQEIEMMHGLGQYAIADSLAHAIKPARPGRFPLVQQALLDAQLG